MDYRIYNHPLTRPEFSSKFEDSRGQTTLAKARHKSQIVKYFCNSSFSADDFRGSTCSIILQATKVKNSLPLIEAPHFCPAFFCRHGNYHGQIRHFHWRTNCDYGLGNSKSKADSLGRVRKRLLKVWHSYVWMEIFWKNQGQAVGCVFLSVCVFGHPFLFTIHLVHLGR